MIKIVNLRFLKPKYSNEFKVDRSSPLGNPYNMNDESKRNFVCDKYEKWFYEAAHNQDFFNYLEKIFKAYKKHKKINLFCWCVPNRCHAETIKKYLEERFENDKV